MQGSLRANDEEGFRDRQNDRWNTLSLDIIQSFEAGGGYPGVREGAYHTRA